MSRLLILRHAPTVWNEERRLQGRADQPLSPAGEALAGTWTLPGFCAGWDRVCSPMTRARQTARIIGRGPFRIDRRLTEMSFGAWEGRRLADLRAELGAEMTAREALGLDFDPPGGESPRHVMARLRPFLAECAARRRDHVAVAHKAIIRSLYALATGWDMTGDAPDKLRDRHCHLFAVDSLARIRLERVNIPLVPELETQA